MYSGISYCKSHPNIPYMSVWSFWAVQDIIMSYRDGAISKIAVFQAIEECGLVLHGRFPCVTTKPTITSWRGWNGNNSREKRRIIRYVHRGSYLTVGLSNVKCIQKTHPKTTLEA